MDEVDTTSRHESGAQPGAHPETAFATDRPISSMKEDVLGRDGFVHALATALARWRGTDSLVVAIYGPWGSGKSSVKNMLVETMRDTETPPAVVEFNPWAWSGQDRLLTAFFTEIGAALGRESKQEQLSDVAAKWRKYGQRLAIGGRVFGGLKKLTEYCGIPVLPVLLEHAADGSSKASELAEEVAAHHEADAEQEESTEELKQALAEALGGREQPLLVVMDDIDRLTTEEIRLLFQLVKVNADFPKVVYLLAFDRAVVEAALTGVGGGPGRDYMEKIVQVGFDLPRPARADLDQAVTRGLDQLLSFEGAMRHFDSERWANLYTFGLRPFFKTLRDARRFLSSFSFTVGLFYRDGTMEANPVDLIGIEVLRLFEPALFHRLPDVKDALLETDSVRYLAGQDDDREERKRAFEALLSVSSEEHREAAGAILCELFPQMAWLRRGYGHGVGHEEGWLRGLRVCTADFFDRYFALAVPRGDVSQATLDALIRVGHDREQVRGMLRSLRDRGMLLTALNRLEAYKTVLDLEIAEGFVTALMDVGDELPERSPGMFELGPDMTVCRIIYHFLAREKDVKKRGGVLLQALEKTDGLYLPVYKVALETDRETGGARGESLFDDDDLARAKAICVAKLEAAARDGRLLGPKLGYLLWRWREWAGEVPPREYAVGVAETPEGCLQLLTGFVHEIQSQSTGSTTVRSRWEMRLKSIEPFVVVCPS